MTCPTCGGRGFVGVPYVTADTCRTCKGRKYLNRKQAARWQERQAQSQRDGSLAQRLNPNLDL